jgi:hypothetical protein
MKVWYLEVQTTGSNDSWAGNAMRYSTKEEAEEAARDLMMRWLAVTAWRVKSLDEEEIKTC